MAETYVIYYPPTTSHPFLVVKALADGTPKLQFFGKEADAGAAKWPTAATTTVQNVRRIHDLFPKAANRTRTNLYRQRERPSPVRATP